MSGNHSANFKSLMEDILVLSPLSSSNFFFMASPVSCMVRRAVISIFAAIFIATTIPILLFL